MTVDARTVTDLETTALDALFSMRDCGDRPGMYDEASQAVAAVRELARRGAEALTLRDALAEARKVLEVIEEPMHFDDMDAIRHDRVRMQAAARAWLAQDRAALATPDGEKNDG